MRSGGRHLVDRLRPRRPRHRPRRGSHPSRGPARRPARAAAPAARPVARRPDRGQLRAAARELRGCGGRRRASDPRRPRPEGRPRTRGPGHGAVGPLPGIPLRCSPGRVQLVLLLLRRHPGGCVHRRQSGAARPPQRRRRGDRRARGVGPPQRRPGGRRPPRRAAPAQRQGPLRARDRGERIERRLSPVSVWVERASEPVVIKVANIQHLATPIHAQLAESRSVLELAELLHPTPAVGPEPRGPEGERLIAELEQLERGWYAGPVGWMDAVEDGEFCVALRSALLRDRTAHLYAGAGIVADSEPAAELAETEIKLGALLPLLGGLRLSPAPPRPARRSAGGARRCRSGRRARAPARGRGRRLPRCRPRRRPADTEARTCPPRPRASSEEGVVNRSANRSGSTCDACGRKSKMPPPPLSITTIRSGPGTAAAAASPPMSCASARSPRIEPGRLAGPVAIPAAVETSPSIPLAPRLAVDRHRRIAALQEGLGVADRHARGEQDPFAVGVGAAERPLDGRLAESPRRPRVPRETAARAAVSASVQSRSQAERSGRLCGSRGRSPFKTAPASARTNAPAIRLGSFQRPGGSITI